MKHIHLIASAFVLTVPAAAWAEPPVDIAQEVEALRQKIGAPGIAIAIVEDGETTLARGWGVRKLGESAPVDGETLFQTGSTGKAKTAAALAILVDEGKIEWDDPVIKHMPWFRMYDPWVTREITIRDLLVHNSGLGLGQGDLLFVPRTNLTRRETVERVAHLKPKTSFRSGYAYDNILYAVAGQLIEEVTGQTWEDFVRERVLRAGGMDNATSDSPQRFATANRSHPHARLSGPLRGLGEQQVLDERDELGRTAAPAGGLALSAEDMADWLKIQLAHGALPDGGRLFSEEQASEMWTPVTIMPISQLPDPLKPAQPTSQAYALGWQVSDYRGHRIISHGGGVFGSITRVVMIPDLDVGFAIMTNSEESGMLLGLTYDLLDHYLDAPDYDWTTKWQTWFEQRLEGGRQFLQSAKAAPAGVGPSLELSRYAGSYRDPWYGDVVIGEGPNGLTIDFTSTPRMTGQLAHWQYDSFVTEFDDPALEPAYVTFALDADGKVTGVTMKPVSKIADFSWDYQDLDLKPVGEQQ
ncbi:serine hydrolase [Altererythrobacter sp. SALINAS58]|uniref:serine hydrolase n=1 Tax=Alteripontixanthobacter muriae TaxID=2705546 RepID=UPI001577605E|nr:serine hydrolase [Alteripontixanthobacter muriae]NTZ43271.1 serine hydrolase [Alteripontixanthobacter muriae]